MRADEMPELLRRLEAIVGVIPTNKRDAAEAFLLNVTGVTRERCAAAARERAAVHRRGAVRDREAGRGFSASDNEAIAEVLEALADDIILVAHG